MITTILCLVAAAVFALEAFKRQTLLPLGLALFALGVAL